MQGEGEECVGRCGGFSRLLAFLVGASGELGCPFSSERVVSGLGFRWNFVTNAEIFHARSQKSLDDADASF
jgi:hypothetical protein